MTTTGNKLTYEFLTVIHVFEEVGINGNACGL